MAPHGLAGVKERRNRFAELPGQFAGLVRLAFIDLSTLRMERRHQRLTWRSNRFRHLGRRRQTLQGQAKNEG
jgi:hypothetical protein